MTPSVYRQFLNLARRYARRSAEADDLLQDALLAAVAAGRSDLGEAGNRRWLAGAIRRRAAFVARSAGRRRRREAMWHAGQPAHAESAVPPVPFMDALTCLPRSLKLVAALALSGHTRREIGYLLHLSDTALRQRIVVLKRHLAAHGVSVPTDLPGLSLDLNYGLIRDALLPELQRQRGVFASHDPDGHLFVIRRSQNA